MTTVNYDQYEPEYDHPRGCDEKDYPTIVFNFADHTVKVQDAAFAAMQRLSAVYGNEGAMAKVIGLTKQYAVDIPSIPEDKHLEVIAKLEALN